MNLGITIKKYRHQQDLTQEQLAEYLNVSVSAVSQWESNKTIPDISTILALANFFGVTLDELFDRTSKEKELEIEKYFELDRQYSNQGEIKKLLLLWREATQKYPGDFNCLINLAYTLEAAVYSSNDIEDCERNAKESIAVCERILRDCNENNKRSSALQILVHLYSEKNLSFASEEVAVQYAMMADNLFSCRDLLLESAYFTEESRGEKQRVKHSNMLNYMDLLTMNLYHGKYDSENEKIEACKVALTLWKTLIYDENYQFFHCRIQKIYLSLATAYAKLKKHDEVIDSLKCAYYHAMCYDGLPKSEQHYTSIFVNAATSDATKFAKNYSCTNAEDVIRFSQKQEFDFVRNDLVFEKI